MKLNISTSTILSLLAFAGFFPDQCNASHEIVRNATRNLKASKSPKASKAPKTPKATKAPKASAERAVTMWWVLFNKPSACAANPSGDVKCGISDVMGNAQAGTNDPEIVIMHATGGIADKDGCLRLIASLYKTGTCDLDLGDAAGVEQYTWGGPPGLYSITGGNSKGYCPADGENTEVHLVVRDHGPETEYKLWQTTRFTDPSCSQNGGPNLCSDIGTIGFPVMTENGVVSGDMGGFPAFPPGCSDAGDCEANVEAIQLSTGNEVTLVVTGDTVQAVAEIILPKV